MNRSDPRGQPIKIHGTGVDNLPAVMDEPMKIVNFVSVSLVESIRDSASEASSELPRTEIGKSISEIKTEGKRAVGEEEEEELAKISA
jgi:hypothetical protein